jgi:hypothetical protein
MRRSITVLGLCLSLGALGCERPAATAADSAQAPAAAPARTAALGRVVFLDQVEACECTQKRIEGSWQALQAALAARPGLPVDRIHADEQAEAAQVYLELAPVMVMPGIYFMDAQENLAEQLQGEITRAQIEAVLSKR